MTEAIEFLLVVGLTGLLYLLRLDAQRFGVAEYDDSDRNGDWRSLLRRISWYGVGLALLLMVYWLYPQPVSVLHLDMGPDRERALIYGLVAGVGGIVLAFLFAWFRYGGFRLPAPGAYPGALLNSVGTAVIDEALFRGVLLGLLLHQGLSVPVAIAIQAVLYGAATRLWTKGRSKGMLFIDLLIAIVGGWLVVETLGIGAAVIAHAITRFAVFLATGHSDQARPVGWEPEEVAGRALPPKGWDLADGNGAEAWMAPPSGPPGLGPSYAGQSPFAPQGYGAAQGYPGPAGWGAPPPGMSNVPMSGPGQYPETPWVPGPGQPPPPGWDAGAAPGPWVDPSSGPWVADPITGEWTPVQPPEGWPQQGPPQQAPPAEGWAPPPTDSDGRPHA
jgi:Type II CAAX prenyl endopeptidase Rce1-like